MLIKKSKLKQNDLLNLNLRTYLKRSNYLIKIQEVN